MFKIGVLNSHTAKLAPAGGFDLEVLSALGLNCGRAAASIRGRWVLGGSAGFILFRAVGRCLRAQRGGENNRLYELVLKALPTRRQWVTAQQRVPPHPPAADLAVAQH